MLIIPTPLFNQMIDHLTACYPLEGCGLLAGNDDGRVTAVYPIENSLHSPVAYKMNPRQQVEAMLDMETNGWHLLVIYHSHPHGPEIPSITDIQQAYYPEALTMIVSLAEPAAPVVRLFHIEELTVTEKMIKVVQPSDKNCV